MDSNTLLFAFDLDGTLLPFGGGLSDGNRKALDAARGAGHIPVIASGRSLSSIPEELLRLKCFSYCISAGGAVLSVPATGEVLAEMSIPRQLALKTMRTASKHGAALKITCGGREAFELKWLRYVLRGFRDAGVEISPWRFLAFLIRRNKNSRGESLRRLILLHGFLRRLAAKTPEPIYKIECVYKTDALCKRQQALFEADEALEAILTAGRNIEITVKGANKGSALAALAKRLDIPRERVIAFGDSNNDLPMRDAAGTLVVMENSEETALKAVADYIAPPVEKDGAAEILYQLLELSGG